MQEGSHGMKLGQGIGHVPGHLMKGGGGYIGCLYWDSLSEASNAGSLMLQPWVYTQYKK